MSTAIRIENVGKLYRVDQHDLRGGSSYSTLRDDIARMVMAPFRKMRGESTSQRHDYWALKDVSFDVKQGDLVGLIGRNGAGKSTLLKILSRITKPTTGRITLKGRISSLLEVGTGFHPELTGRENIYLNGAILGMTRAEISRKFDQIVAFSEIEKFLDTPVKRYSSGMHVRLAFAVAAHLEPEILIVDEVLAVGDFEFQRKCLGKMQEVGQEGRTVIFVSHNMAALQTLCERGVVLKQGQVLMDGPIEEAARFYLAGIDQAATGELLERTDRHGAGQVRMAKVEVTPGEDHSSRVLMTGRSVRFCFQLDRAYAGADCLFSIYDQRGQAIVHFDSRLRSPDDERVNGETQTFTCWLDELYLLPGRYRVNTAVFVGETLQDHIEGAALFEVENGPVRGRVMSTSGPNFRVGFPHRWVGSV